MTMDEYFRATPDKRATIDALKPPTAHTHRGKPVDFSLQGHHEATKPARTPTHRKTGPAVVPARFAHLAIAQETTYA